ncbi:MAG: DUF3144 domain-containing protein [Arenicella sp.]
MIDMQATDKEFYDRADAFIRIANEQLNQSGQIPTNTSFMYAVCRFNAWVVASGFEKQEEMKFAKAGALDYFVNQYKEMLDEHLDDYIANFDAYTEQQDA